jgi:galactose-6-phosphate isomerase
MTMLDVSVALTNPYTIDQFTVQRRADTVSNFGESTLTLQQLGTQYGVITPAGNNDLLRLPDEQRMKKSIVVFTSFKLRGACKDGVAQAFQPDIVVWSGNNFLVLDLEDYSHYGPGYVKAVCVMIDLIPLAI